VDVSRAFALGSRYLPIGTKSGHAFSPWSFAYTRLPSFPVYQALKISRYPDGTATFGLVAIGLNLPSDGRLPSAVPVLCRKVQSGLGPEGGIIVLPENPKVKN